MMDRGVRVSDSSFNTYLSLCTQVYDLSKPTAPRDAFAFYRDYAVQANGPIIEPMCGSGRFLLPLVGEGFDVQGFDASQHMLDALHVKASQRKLHPNVWRGFIEDWETSDCFKLIFIASASFGLLTNECSIQAALKQCYDHLAEEGILLLDVQTPVGDANGLGVWRGAWYPRSDGKRILFSHFSTLHDAILTTVCKYELVDKNNIIHTEMEEIRVRLYNHTEFIHLMHQAGFTQVRAMKAFSKNLSPDPHDECIVYECRK